MHLVYFNLVGVRGANQVTGEIIGWSDNLWNVQTEYAVTGVSTNSNTGTITFQGDVAPTITGVQAASAVSLQVHPSLLLVFNQHLQ